MAINAREFKVTGQWAKDADTVIPPIPVSGRSYRRLDLTQADIEKGQPYDAIWESARNNQAQFETSGIAKCVSEYGLVPWSPLENYQPGALQLGRDGIPYRCMKANGPETADPAAPGRMVGARDPADPDNHGSGKYWQVLGVYLVEAGNVGSYAPVSGSLALRNQLGCTQVSDPVEDLDAANKRWVVNALGVGGGSAGDLVYPSAFADFMEQSPPAGWMVRNGALINNASRTVPELWEALRKPENDWKLLSEKNWLEQSQSEPWNGIGGVPQFVLDVSANTIRLPDTRGMYREDAGFDFLTVAGVHGDAIRNINGNFTYIIQGSGGTGVFRVISSWSSGYYGAGGAVLYAYNTQFDAANVVPTANKNQPRAFGILGCVYVGRPGS